MAIETKLEPIREADRMLSNIRSNESLTEEERTAEMTTMFGLFRKLDKTGKDLLIGRHLHPLFFSFLRRNETRCIRTLALYLSRDYEFGREEGAAVISALSKGYAQQIDRDRGRAILDCIFGVAKTDLSGAFESALTFARKRDPSAV
ncbi:MAG: hypothetical protein NT076_01605 [Candidatus Pacearchaeota archaeon]|nr:hypothetical protein [Candidatus Pacearchaeota archaeon]